LRIACKKLNKKGIAARIVSSDYLCVRVFGKARGADIRWIHPYILKRTR